MISSIISEKYDTIDTINIEIKNNIKSLQSFTDILNRNSDVSGKFIRDICTLCEDIKKFIIETEKEELKRKEFVSISIRKFNEYYTFSHKILNTIADLNDKSYLNQNNYNKKKEDKTITKNSNTKNNDIINNNNDGDDKIFNKKYNRRDTKIDIKSNLNVIKINIQSIDISSENKTIITTTNHHNNNNTTYINNISINQNNIDNLMLRNNNNPYLRNIITSINEINNTRKNEIRKIESYIKFYHKIGNTDYILTKISNIVNSISLIESFIISIGITEEKIKYISTILYLFIDLFDKSINITKIEIKNMTDYILNNINKYREYSLIYNKLIEICVSKDINITNNDDNNNNNNNGHSLNNNDNEQIINTLSSMYQ